MATERSPVVLIYRRASMRLGPLRDSLEREDFHRVTPPDALGDWEYRHDEGIRVRGGPGLVLVEAWGDRLAVEFDARYRISLPSDGDVPDGGEAPERVEWIAGSDESGKGQSDRPLAVAAVAVPVEDETAMLERGVRDSKLCTGVEIAVLAEWIMARCGHALEVVDPADREAAQRAHGGNETRLLAAMHARALARVHGHRRFSIARVDRFAPNRPVAAALRGTLSGVLVDECMRGERHVACAAASIVARAAVLRAVP